MDKVADGIYVGSLESLNDIDNLKAHGITHILSLVTDQVQDMQADDKKFVQLQVKVLDDEDEDIMQYFAVTNAFIESALSQGTSVLVHCVAGVSRSVTAVCAYLLFKAYQNDENLKTKLSVENVISTIQETRPNAIPNDSFQEQLELYLASGCEVSNDKPLYRQWILKKQAEGISFTGAAPTVAQYISSSGSTATVGKTIIRDSQSAVPLRSTQLRCKKCRTALAASQGFILHIPASGAQQYGAPRNGMSFTSSLSPHCMQYFMEPVIWMKPELEKGLLQGKFGCPRCNAKIGSYSWKGGKCSCGKWVTPAIEIQRARVDEVPA